ncbi:putative reverse transcriptase domain-containing protein, partial [Tanacetum coccineum]
MRHAPNGDLRKCGLKTSHDHTSMGDVGNTGVGIASSKDGIAIAETGIMSDREMAGPEIVSEHTCMEDVVNTGVAQDISQDGIASNKGGRDFVFGRMESTNGILKKPDGPFLSVQFGNVSSSNPFVKKAVAPKGGAWTSDGIKSFGPSILSNQFSADVDRFAEKLKQGTEEIALKMEYVPSSVSKLENGNRRISFSAEEVYKGGQACSLQLYGYFVGTSMDYRVVRGNLMRMWRVHDIEEITKTNSGVYYFKFKSEEGMKRVLESGPWMIQNVPLVLNVWEPGIWLEKTEPSSIPIWVCVYNIPMELCNGGGIGKIMSGVGKPLLMDKMTRERCLKKAGKMDFARVLVEVSAEDDLPNVLEIEYPPLGIRPARVGKLEVKYQWRPPLCTHCKTFGHSTLACKVRPRTEGEIAAAVLKEAIKVNSVPKDFVDSNINDDGFVTVGRKNKPIEKNQVPPKMTSQVKQGVKFQNRGGFNSGRQYGSGFQHSGKQGGGNYNFNGQRRSSVFVQRNQVLQKNSVNANKNDTIGKSGVKLNVGNGSSAQDVKKGPLVVKPGHASVYNKDFRPKVLVRGSNSDGDSKKFPDEAVPVSNSFDLLSDEAMNEEYATSIWPKLKGDVDEFMENGIYPTKEIRAEWSLRQMEYFYNNCHKFHLDPAYEDEEDDVNSEVDGVASDMKPEFEINDAEVLVNDSAKAHDLLREDAYSLCGLLETHVKKKNLNRICKRVLGNWEWVSNISSCNGGTRIIVGWDPHNVSVMVLEQSSQVLHCFVEPVNGDPSFFCSFVYAAVHTVDRRSLWKALHKHKLAVKDRPWVILGDFNACLDPSERSSGCSKVTTAMNDFRDCVSDIEVEDIAMSGLRFTWNKKPGMEGGLLKKLDRVLGNSSFMTSFPSSYAHFLPFMLSDHTPAVFTIPEVRKVKPKPFKFHNYLSSKDAFIPTVSGVWSNKVEGFSMFSLVSKLKMLKRPLRKLNFDQGNLFENVKRLRSELAIAQSSLCLDPHNRLLREVEAKTLKAYKSALKDEESFLKQKSKVEWLDEGDKNTRYFHNVVKGRLNRNRISYVEDINGNAFHGLGVGEQFVLHF